MNKIAALAVFFIACLFFSCHTPNRMAAGSLKNIDSIFIGRFTDDYKIRYTLTPQSLTQHPGVTYHFILYNKKEQYFIARNDTANISDAGLYTRIDIMRFNGMEPWLWGFCLTAYKAGSIQEAVNTAAADRANPKKGCGGYPFSRMKRIP